MKKELLLLVCLIIGGLLFNQPIINLFDVATTCRKIPVLFIYLFVVWGVFICGLFWLSRQKTDE